MFATERNSSICVKSIQRSSSSTNPHLPMASGDFSMHFSHDFVPSFLRTTPLLSNIVTQAHTHTILDHGLQMGMPHVSAFSITFRRFVLISRTFLPHSAAARRSVSSHPLVKAKKIPHKLIKVCGGTCSLYADGLSLSGAAFTRYLYNVLMRSGNTGIAPCDVHTKALVSTAAR